MSYNHLVSWSKTTYAWMVVTNASSSDQCCSSFSCFQRCFSSGKPALSTTLPTGPRYLPQQSFSHTVWSFPHCVLSSLKAGPPFCSSQCGQTFSECLAHTRQSKHVQDWKSHCNQENLSLGPLSGRKGKAHTLTQERLTCFKTRNGTTCPVQSL